MSKRKTCISLDSSIIEIYRFYYGNFVKIDYLPELNEMYTDDIYIFRKEKDTQEKIWDKPVKCRTCFSNCCKKDWEIIITLDYYKINSKYCEFISDYFRNNQVCVLKKNEKNICPYLNLDSGLCTIYETRPYTCRTYYCETDLDA